MELEVLEEEMAPETELGPVADMVLEVEEAQGMELVIR